MLSVSFFCTRKQNLLEIITTYQKYELVDEVLIVVLEPVQVNNKPEKFKIITMPKDSDLGLLSRYTFALACKNRKVFIQDDDWIYTEEILKKLDKVNEPLVGCHPRWFYNNEYQKQPETNTTTAPILLTCGVLVDTWYLPAVIQDSLIFWKDYQNVFNGEDIFMSRSIAKASGQDKFKFFNEGFKALDMSNPLWEKNDGSRSKITQEIYEYFNE